MSQFHAFRLNSKNMNYYFLDIEKAIIVLEEKGGRKEQQKNKLYLKDRDYKSIKTIKTTKKKGNRTKYGENKII